MTDVLDLSTVTIDTFVPLVNTGFGVCHPQHRETLSLTGIRPGRGQPGGRAAFALTFKGESREVCFGQGTYRLDHATLGRLEIFFTPIRRDADGTFLYEACFN